MRCNYLIGALVVAVCAASASRASAQNITGFTDGYNDVGPVVGFGNLGLGSVSYGGRFEHGFKELPNLGNGSLALGVSADYYHFSTGFSVFSASSYDYSVIPIAVTVNYHFHLDNKQIDPFVGAGIG